MPTSRDAGEVPSKRKRAGPKDKDTSKKVKKERKVKRVSTGKPNKWIAHYMEWRLQHPEVVAANKNIGDLVRMARETYEPVKQGFQCRSCGAANEPPLMRVEE